MHKTLLRPFLHTCSDNLKSKIQNLKWGGILAIGVTFAMCEAVAQAQQPKKTPRIGFLSVGSASSMSARVEAFRQGLREHGYVEGQNILVEYRYAEGKLERLKELTGELINLRVEVIVTGGSQSTRPAKEATGTIPIVMAYEADPLASGVVSSLARPGGNITGLTSVYTDLTGKRLELLKEVIPKLSRVAILWNATVPGSAEALKEAEVASQSLGLKLQPLEVRSPDDLDGAFHAAVKGRAGAFMVASNPVTFTHRKRVSELATQHRLPTIHGQIQFAEAGGLMVYGPNDADMYRRAATYVDKILKGAKPADLPVEQPTKFEFIINLKAAKQIGLTIPPNVLAQADKVIR
jgi:putative tryptophan/tyrosine transport system substrate-binding protein